MERTRAATQTQPAGEGPRSFDEFFEAEAPALFRRLCLVTGSRPEAEDVMQEAFMKIFERWDRVAGLEDPQGYLYRTAFNVFRGRLRRAAVAVRRQLRLAAPRDAFENVEDRDLVARGLAGLTPRQRAALVLTELLGYSSKEAGRILGIRPVTVRALASQGRTSMREQLGGGDV